MITILHGDHQEASRTELKRLREQHTGVEIREVNAKALDPALLTQAVSSSSLFDAHILVIIEHLIASANKKSKAFDQYAAIIREAAETCDIVLWEGKEITPAGVRPFGAKANVRLFKFPVLIFQFLDALRPGNAQMLLDIFEKLRASEPSELIFTMMVGRIRQLIQVSGGVPPANLKDWQQTRLTTQSNSFSMEKLVACYTRLRDIEYSIKSAGTPFALSEHIEQFIIQL